MKKIILSSAMAFAMVLSAIADKEVTITGDGQCAKCSLKETKACQNAIVVEKDGKKTTYFLVDNDVSKKFHGEICTETKKVTAVGTVKEKDGKQELTVTKIETAK